MSRRTCHRRVRVWLIGTVLLALAGLAIAYLAGGEDEAVRFRTTDAQTGDLTVIVTATGQLKPVNQVDVGTEVSGTIESVVIDYNDHVSAGQVLAQLDTAKLDAQVLQSKAALASARARVNEMEATVVETRLKSERCKRLAENSLCSREDLDTAQAAHLRAQAQEADARAKVAEAAAKLSLDETDLGKAVIRAPIDAIVLERQVEPGQTVAASLQTPVLFTLAEDLRTDGTARRCGRGRCGSGEGRASGDLYRRCLSDAQLSGPHHPGALRAAHRRGRRDLRDAAVGRQRGSFAAPRHDGDRGNHRKRGRRTPCWCPMPRCVSPRRPRRRAHSKPAAACSAGCLSAAPPKRRNPCRGKPAAGSRQQVWVLRDGRPVAVPVTVGVSDSRQTEILDGELAAGMPVIVDMTGSEQ